jgi:hypothetical protein
MQARSDTQQQYKQLQAAQYACSSLVHLPWVNAAGLTAIQQQCCCQTTLCIRVAGLIVLNEQWQAVDGKVLAFHLIPALRPGEVHTTLIHFNIQRTAKALA